MHVYKFACENDSVIIKPIAAAALNNNLFVALIRFKKEAENCSLLILTRIFIPKKG